MKQRKFILQISRITFANTNGIRESPNFKSYALQWVEIFQIEARNCFIAAVHKSVSEVEQKAGPKCARICLLARRLSVSASKPKRRLAGIINGQHHP